MATGAAPRAKLRLNVYYHLSKPPGLEKLEQAKQTRSVLVAKGCITGAHYVVVELYTSYSQKLVQLNKSESIFRLCPVYSIFRPPMMMLSID